MQSYMEMVNLEKNGISPEKFKDTETWGCNRIYEEGVELDNLVCVDYIRQHEVYKSGYAYTNKCWFLDYVQDGIIF